MVRFGGVSTTTNNGEYSNFETCYQSNQNETYCWTKSYRYAETSISGGGHFVQCFLDGDDLWHYVRGAVARRAHGIWQTMMIRGMSSPVCTWSMSSNRIAGKEKTRVILLLLL